MHWKGIIIVVFNLVTSVSDGLRCHFTTSDSVDEFKLFVIESDISLIELVPDCPPPIFILGLLYELSYFIILLFLCYLLQFLIIAEMFEFIIPAVRNFAYLDFSQLIILVV